MKWMILVAGVLSNALASVLVKYAMVPPRRFPSLEDPWAALGNWPFWLGLTLYGAAFLLYAAALARLPLNIAHPILTSGSIALVALVSFAVLRETFYLTTWIGIALIIEGVILITMRVPSN